MRFPLALPKIARRIYNADVLSASAESLELEKLYSTRTFDHSGSAAHKAALTCD